MPIENEEAEASFIHLYTENWEIIVYFMFIFLF